jgi:hypothetical protein
VILGDVDGLTAPEQPQQPGAEGDAPVLDMPGRLHVTSRIRRQTLSPQPSDPLEEDSRLVLNSRRNATISRNAIIFPIASLPVTAQSLLSNTVNPTNAGALTNGT